MKKILLKGISLFLVLLMIYSSVPVSVFATVDLTETQTESFVNESKEYDSNIENLNIQVGDEYNLFDNLGDFEYSIDGEKVIIKDYTGGKSEVSIPYGVTSIGDYAFNGNTDLTSITIPDSVASIGECAFRGCSGLTSITIPDNVISIGVNAFYNTQYYNNDDNWRDGVLYIGNHLIKVVTAKSGAYEIRESTKSIGDSAFADCTEITSITIPDSVTSIGEWAFSRCESLAKVTIPDSVTTIGEWAFYDCESLAKVTIPNSVTTIGGQTFCLCKSLSEVTIPNSVTTIGDSAFSSCDSLTSIIIPDSVTAIGDSAFSSCDSLTSITIPDSVTTIGERAFYYCSELMCIMVDENNQYFSNDEFGTLFNKNKTTLIQYPIGNTRTAYTIPDSVTTIGEWAFSECESLAKVTIPDSVTTIGDSAFSSCDSLTSITIPDSVTTIGEQAFSYCESLAKVTIPNSVTAIGDSAFSSCYSLTSITIPDSVTTIGDSAFYYCSELMCITVDENNQYFSNDEFGTLFNKNKTTLIQYPIGNTRTAYTIPDSVTTIGERAFSDCESLAKVTIPDSVTIIGDYAFFICMSLMEITIPDSVTTIGDSAFNCCISLTSITIPDSVTTIGDSAFSSCISLTSITIPDSVTTIGYSAFSFCDSLTSVTLGNSVTTIGDSAFSNCVSLTSVTLGDSVTTIGDSAFRSCGSLVEVYYSGTKEQWTKINIGSNNVNLTGVNIHYICYHFNKIAHSQQNPTCTEKGYTAGVYCPDCEEWLEGHESVDALGHSCTNKWKTIVYPTCTENGYEALICDLCGEPDYIITDETIVCDHSDYPESPHNYGSNESYEYEFSHEGAKKLILKFSSNTETESNYDNIFIYDGKGDLVGTFSGTQLKSKTVEINGDRFKIKLTTDSSVTRYGFSFELITAVVENKAIEYSDKKIIPAIEHNEIIDVAVVATCTKTGLTEGKHCSVCNKVIIAQQEVPSLGHEYAFVHIDATEGHDGHTLYTCIRCDDSYIVLDPAVIVSNFYVVSETYQCALSWAKAVESTVTGYNIYRKTVGDEDFVLYKTVSGRNTVSFIDTKLTAGQEYSYKICAVKEDIIGEMSDVATGVPTKDTEKPIITKVNLGTNTTFNGVKRLTVNAQDNVGIVNIKMFISTESNINTGTLVYESKSSALNYDFNSTEYKDGKYYVWFVATDADSNESDPMSCVYYIDNTGPAKITGLKAKAVLSTIITLEWKDVDDNDVACYVLQQKTADGYKTLSSSITTLGYNVQGLVPGTAYTFRVAAKDIRGNVGAYSDEFTVSTAEDTIAPVVTDLSPSPSRYNSYVPFRASAGDDFAIKTIAIQVSTDLKNWETVSTKEYTSYSATATYNYNVSLAEYEDVSVYVRAIATDFAGNESDTSTTAPFVEYIVDKTAPENPVGLTAVGGEGWICVSWTQGSEDDLSTYSLYRSTEEDGVYSCIASGLKTLNHYDNTASRYTDYYYKLRVQDTTGNLSDFSEVVTARVKDDTIVPEVVSVNPSNGSIVGPHYKTVETFVKDNYLLDKIVIEYRINNDIEFDILKEFNNINASYTTVRTDLPVAQLNDGDKIYIRVKTTDIVGLESEYSAEYTYSVDKVAPTISNLTVVVENDNAKITWSDKDCTTDISGYKVYRVNSNGTYSHLGSRSYSSSRNYVFYNYLNLVSGDYTYMIEAYDRVGNYNTYLTDVLHYEYVKPEEVNTPPNAVIDGHSVMEIGVEEVFDAGKSTDNGSIVSYLWDFGDGTSSNEVKVVKKYTEVGTYNVTLTLTDEKGLISTEKLEVTVSERTVVGTVKVKVVDENGSIIKGAPVYFDLGGENQKIVYSDNSGFASLLMEKGEHTVGVFHPDYLPVKKEVTVLPNATRAITMTIIKQEIVTGEFEVTRMTFEEIQAAGINAYAPENQQVYSVSFQITYGEEKIPVSYIRNNSGIISFNVGNSGGNSVSGGGGSGGGKSNSRNYTGFTFIPNKEGKEIVAFLDIPAEASYLKEFFDVKLHITNNASSEFELIDNEVYLDVPSGMTMMTGLTGGWNESPTVKIDSIKGQQTETLAWVLRGDKEGEYHLNADFNGTLDVFDEQIHANFKTDEPIKVYGLSNIKINLEVNDEIKYNAFYFNIGLENTGDIDIYNPCLDFDGIVSNITASAVKAIEGIDKTQGEADFDVEATLLNVRIEHEDGTAQYVPFTWNSNGTVNVVGLDTLTPGDAIYYEYVAYNAINYDSIAFFNDAAYEVLGEYGGEVEIRTVPMQMYSMLDAEEKLMDATNVLNVDTDDSTENKFNPADYTYYAKYKSAVTEEEIELPFLYDDSFFKKSSTEGVNNGLALASIYLSSNAYHKDTKVVKKLMSDMGYNSIELKNYDNEATEDNNDFVGYTFATKKINVNNKDYDVVAIVVRGTPTSLEWLSNFNIGTGTQHMGFTLAAVELNTELEAYLSDKGLNKETTKFWITGHSRGAAVANIVAEYLTATETYALQDNIYAYTFATPATKTDANTDYTNIINYCNTDDLIAYIPMKEWDYKKAGQTVNFSMNANSRMTFAHFTKKEYKGVDEVADLVSALVGVAPDSKSFYGDGAYSLMRKIAFFLADEESDANFYDYLNDIIVNGSDHSDAYLNLISKLLAFLEASGVFCLDAIYHAHSQDGYISYLESIYSYESILATIRADKGVTHEALEITKDNAFAYLMDDSNYMYYMNSSVGQRVTEAHYQALKLLLTLDFNTLTKDEQKKTVEQLLIALITDDYTGAKIENQIDTQYIDAVTGVLGSLESIFSSNDFSADYDGEKYAKIARTTLSNKDDVYELASVLKVQGDEGLQSELIKRFALGSTTSLGIEAVKSIIYQESSYTVLGSALMQNIADVSKYSGKFIDAVVVKPIQLYNDVAYAEYINGLMNMFASNYEANLILDTIIDSYSKEDQELDKKLDLMATVVGYALPVVSLLNAVDVDVRQLVVEKAKELKEDMNKKFDGQIEALKLIMKDVITDAVKSELSKAIGSMLGKANVWYLLLGTAFKLVDNLFGVADYYKATDTFNIASYITLSLMVGFNQRLYAYNTPDEIEDLNNQLGTKYNEDELDVLALDCMSLLKAITNTRLLGEYTYKTIVNDNNATVIKGDSEYDAQIVSKCNDKFGTNYSNIEDVYDYIYKNILMARDAVFNVEYTSDIVKPEAPVVTFNYSTLTTNQEFDSTYEYCLSDGEWKTCDGKIAVELKTTTQVLRVRKAAGNSSVAGHITTVTIYAQKELSKIITVKYDDGTYYFTNLLDTYTYEVCPIDSRYDAVNWNEGFEVKGGSNATAKGDGKNYIAIRTLGNSGIYETISKTAVIPVSTKQELTVTTWGNGTVTQPNEDGKYFVGDDVALAATAGEGSTFSGWYIDGEQVSRDAEYILAMYDEAEVVAKFTDAKPVEAQSVQILGIDSTEYTGTTVKAKADIYPVYTSDKTLTWSSSDEDIAAVDGDGKVTFLSAGNVTITVKLNNNVSASVDVKVVDNKVVDLRIFTPADKTSYLANENLDLTGLVVIAEYTNGDIIAVEEYTVSGYENVCGAKNIVVAYADKTVEFTVQVNHVISATATVAPDCTNKGYTVFECSYCDYSYNDDYVDENGHTEEIIDAVNPTCEDVGYTEGIKCSVCDTVIVEPEEIEALKHDYGEWYFVTEPDCTTVGEEKRECSRCDEFETREAPATNHKNAEAFEQQDATCTEVGYTAGKYCPDCKTWIEGHEEISSIAHKNKVHHEKVLATCVDTGSIEYWSCPDCSKNFSDENCTSVVTDITVAIDSSNHETTTSYNHQEATCLIVGYTAGIFCEDCGTWISGHGEIPAIAHKNKVYHTKVDATCISTGTVEYWACPDCDKNYSDEACTTTVTVLTIEIDSTNHTNKAEHAQVNATCTEVGYTAGIYCADCKAWVEGHEEIEALKHDFGEWYFITKPTCTTAGEEKRDCSHCDHFETRTADKLEHSYSDKFTVDKNATCTVDGSKSRHCVNCDAKTDVTVIKAKGHKYTESVINPATCTTDGLIMYECSCGNAYTEVEPAHGHGDANGDGYCDYCDENLAGDNTCSCNCHKTGIASIIWKILRFFYKLFKINPVCECGARHY